MLAKMKYLLTLVILFPAIVLGQDNADEEFEIERQKLLTVAQSAKHDSTQVRAYFNLYRIVRFQYPKQGLMYCEKADSICQINLQNKLTTEEREWFLQLRSSTIKGIGNYHGRRGNADLALPYFEQSLRIAEELKNDEYIASALTNVANVYFLKGDLATAVEMYTKSLRMNEKIGYDRGISSSLINISAVYQAQKEYEKAIDYIKRAYNLDRKLAPDRWSRTALYVSEKLMKVDRLQEARTYLDEGINQAIKLSDTRTHILGLTILGDLYLVQTKLDSAELLYVEAYNMSVDFDNTRMIAKSSAQLANVYFKNKNYGKSLKYSRIGLETAQENQLIAYIRDAAKWRFKSFEAIGNNAEAFVAYKTFITARDSIYSEENQREILNQEFQYNYNKKVLADSIRIQSERYQQEIRIKREEAKSKRNRTLAYAAFGILAFALVFILILRRQKKRIAYEQDRSDKLLLNILPEKVAEELKDLGRTEARQYHSASVLFTDFSRFTEISSKLSAKELVIELNTCFEAFDHIVGKYQIEKIKTIGDAYMAAGGISDANDNSVKNTILAALEMQEYIIDRKSKANGKDRFEMRVGVHQGPVVAGVVGVKKFQYDLWGDTVNTASRMESHGEIGYVNISDSTYQMIKGDPEFVFSPRESIKVKGKGEMKMWFVSIRK